jgi:hypothetical protein
VSDLREMELVASSLLGETLRVAEVAGCELLRRGRRLTGAGIGVAGSFLLAALCAGSFAPSALGQGQSGAATQGQASPVAANSSASSSAKPQAGGAGQTAAGASASDASAQKPADAGAQSEPKMEDQSAPAAESLGEAARRARTQKPQGAKPKVYTDDAVTTLSGHGVSVVGDGNSGGGGASYSGNSGSGGGGGAQGAAGSQESYWRGRANEIRRQMAACDQKISEIQDEIAKHGAVSVDPMSGAQAGVIFVEDRNAQIKQVERQKEGFERQLEELAEGGRKAGADSGWFR